jgi:O-acetyl-ADP-ribose deacetylase (regulator of RNase III)
MVPRARGTMFAMYKFALCEKPLRLLPVLPVGHALSMEMSSGIPALHEIVAELRLLRERGLVRLRHTDLEGLARAARRAGLATAAGGPGGVEALVRAAVDNLGGGSLGGAAAATFGLGRGERDMAAQDRRRRAALNYGVSVERFRKHHERIVLEQVAEEILKLCMTSDTLDRAPAMRAELDQQINLACQVGGHRLPVVVHIEPIELLSDVDIIVVPDNIYLQLPQHFKSSVSAAIRWAAAIKSDDGEIITDVVGDELTSWLRRHGRVGLPVAPGTVVVAGPGQLAVQRVRRIYHAAIAVPIPGTNHYDVGPAAVAGSVRNVLALARAERHLFEPELRSLAFPLIGSGRGGLSPATSFTWLWTALERDIRDNGPWSIHFVTPRRSVAELIVARLGETGAVTDGRHQAGT